VKVTRRQHEVHVLAGGKQLGGWMSYAITSSIVDPVDTFTLTLPWSRAAHDLVRTDTPVKVTIDGVVVVNGYIDDRETPSGEDVITIAGRCRVGRLVQESAPGIDWRRLTLQQLVGRLAAPHFTRVTLSNERNRKVLRGRGRKARAASEPVLVDPRPGGLLAEPGQTRWAVIESLLAQAEMLAWSAGDGRELVIGRPNYKQEPQWSFFRPAPGSSRMAEGNAGVDVRESTGDRYSRIIVVGGGAGTDASYGVSTTSRWSDAKDNLRTTDGTGKDFTAPKVLVLQEAVNSAAEASTLARREMARRAAKALAVTVTAQAHGQLVGGSTPTLFCPDTLAQFEDERTGRRGAYLVTTCRYESDREGGERTTMDLVPKGTVLA
jgi:prophage tail gpP-like protein